jgi:hypothetical protein
MNVPAAQGKLRPLVGVAGASWLAAVAPARVDHGWGQLVMSRPCTVNAQMTKTSTAMINTLQAG